MRINRIAIFAYIFMSIAWNLTCCSPVFSAGPIDQRSNSRNAGTHRKCIEAVSPRGAIQRVGLFRKQSADCGSQGAPADCAPQNCGPAPNCVCPPPCQPDYPRDEPRGDEPRGDEPRGEELIEEAPTFVTPPPSGEVTGESRSVELPTASITLPEIKLSLPRLALHGKRKSRRAPEMRVDAGVAPITQGPPQLFGQLMTNEVAAEEPFQDKSADEPRDEPRGEEPPDEPRGGDDRCGPGEPRPDRCGPNEAKSLDNQQYFHMQKPVPAPPSEEPSEQNFQSRQGVRGSGNRSKRIADAEKLLRQYETELARLREEIEEDLEAELIPDEGIAPAVNLHSSQNSEGTNRVRPAVVHILSDVEIDEPKHLLPARRAATEIRRPGPTRISH